jgi:hypothetical protein
MRIAFLKYISNELRQLRPPKWGEASLIHPDGYLIHQYRSRLKTQLAYAPSDFCTQSRTFYTSQVRRKQFAE